MSETETAPRVGAVGRARASVVALDTLARIRRQRRRIATDDERRTLDGWSGWGPLAPAYAPKDATWVEIMEGVRAALPAEDVESGMQATYNAFYTPTDVAQSMWQLLAATGFTGGRVLEPGCGGGVFMRTAPDTACMVGVERDRTSADICQLSNPGATVIASPFESARVGDGFDAAIGNVPFGNVRVHDPAVPWEMRNSLHDYFIYRTVRLLRPGGVAVLLTSRFTMDKRSHDARERIGEDADLVGAFRLPAGALGGGTTDAVADVLILRRKVVGEQGSGLDWMLAGSDRFGYDNPVNDYWAGSPAAVLGNMCKGQTSQYGLGVTVVARPGDAAPGAWLAGAAGSVAVMAQSRGLTWQPAPDDDDEAGQGLDLSGMVTAQGWYEGAIRELDDGSMVKVEGGQAVPISRPGAELRALVRLRALAAELIALESDHDLTDGRIGPVRQRCAQAYREYVAAHGPLNRCKIIEGPVDEETGEPTYTRKMPQMGGFRKDPDACLVFALEVYDDDTGQAQPAPILSTRQNVRTVRAEHTDDPAQALAWSLDRSGDGLNLEAVAGILRVDVDQVPGLLGDLVYQDPATLRWVTAEEYLSGNVRTKLLDAQAAAADEPGFARNVEALTGVQPPWLGPEHIATNMGAPWVSAADIGLFVHDLLCSHPRHDRYCQKVAEVRYAAQVGQWEVDVPHYRRGSVESTAQWGTADVDAFALIQLELNGKAPVVYRTVTIDGKERQRRDPEASMLASEKQVQIRQRFADWLWEDPDRTDRIVHEYNTNHNCLVPRRYSGAHITVDGLAPWFTPYPHQLEMVARAVGSRASLCGHPVGAGKTATMAMSAMKMRQLGLVNKALVVVPKHLLEQIDREFRQLFPAARIMSASADTIAANRRLFNARCATQPWDIILITSPAFDRMPVSPDVEAAYLEEQVQDLDEAVRAACPDGKLSGRMVKGLAKRKDNLDARIRDLKHLKKGYDRGVTFEQMGVGCIFMDEAHYYKNLAVPVRADGFSIRPSKRATAFEIKMRWLAGRGTGPYAVLLTGTPVSNTMLELYVVMRYLMHDHMKRSGIGTADAWCRSYVQMVTSVDVTIDGGEFQLVTKPQLFVNAPELRTLLSQVADIRTAEQLGLKRPTAIVETVACPPTRIQRGYSSRLVKRAAVVKGSGRGKAVRADGRNDNMLAICGDGRRMATDPELVGLYDPAPGKLDTAAQKIAQQWREHPDQLQIVFCDVGTPNKDKGSQTYGRLRRMLTGHGIPAGRIRFIHDAANDGDKAALFADCRAGKVSVIMGSTDKLGVGTNIQRRVVAMHHIDAPYRPADVEQRDGRGLRPGNLNPEVRICRYVTERTFDAYLWQMLTRKAGFIVQVLSGSVDRTVEDVGADVVDSYAAVKAIATGQPLLFEKAKIEADVRRLRGLQSGYRSTINRLKRDIERRTRGIAEQGPRAQAWEGIAAHTWELDEEGVARLHEEAKTFGRHRRRGEPAPVFCGLTFTFAEWRTFGESEERHPELLIDGGSGQIDLRIYRHDTPQNLDRTVARMVASAADSAAGLRKRIADAESENERAEQYLTRPFEQEAELAAASARLDQVNAALHEAALHRDEDGQDDDEDEEISDEEMYQQRPAAPAPAPVPAGAEVDPFADLGDVFGQMAAEYDALTMQAFAEMMAAA